MGAYPVSYRNGAKPYQQVARPGLSNAPSNGTLLEQAIAASELRHANPLLYESIRNADAREDFRRVGVALRRDYQDAIVRAAKAEKYIEGAKVQVLKVPWRRVPILATVDAAVNAAALVESLLPMQRPGSPDGYTSIYGPYEYGYPWSGDMASSYQSFNGPLTMQAITAYPLGYAFPDAPPFIGIWIHTVTPNLDRWAHVQTYAKDIGTEGTVQWRTITEVVPMGESAKAAALAYWALPKRQLDPALNGQPSNRTQPILKRQLQPTVQTAQGLVHAFQVSTTYHADGSITPSRGPTSPDRKPPYSPPNIGNGGNAIKERKMIATIGQASLIGRAVNAITESLDVLDAAWLAIPPDKRPGMVWRAGPRRRKAAGEVWYSWDETVLKDGERGHWVRKWNPNPTYKAQWIYDHYEDVSAKAFVHNLLVNQLEDAAIGKASSATTKNLQPWYNKGKNPVGVFTGPAL